MNINKWGERIKKKKEEKRNIDEREIERMAVALVKTDAGVYRLFSWRRDARRRHPVQRGSLP